MRMFPQRQRLGGVGDDFTSASPASIDARMLGRISRTILPVEVRTDADFHIVAAPEECHRSSSWRKDVAAYCGQRTSIVLRKHPDTLDVSGKENLRDFRVPELLWPDRR
jgi:hypothetical protein